MRKRHFFLIGLLCILTPGFRAQARVGDWLNFFYSQGKTLGESQEKEVSEPFELPLNVAPAYEVPVLPTEEDLLELRKKIVQSEEDLSEIKSTLEEKGENIEARSQGAGRAEYELQILEEASGENDKALKKASETVKAIESQISRLMEEKSILRVYYQEALQSYQKFLLDQYERQYRLGGGREGFFLTWFLSKTPASQWLLDREKVRNQEIEKKQKQFALDQIRMEYEERERSLLRHYFERQKNLTLLSLQDRKLLLLKDSREKELHELRKTKLYESLEAQDLERKKKEIVLELQDLHHAYDQMLVRLKAQGIDTEVSGAETYQFPVDPPIRLSATFHDGEYEAQLGKIHDGLDFLVDQGTPVKAIAPGVIEEVHEGGLGYSYILLHHEDGRYSVYGHLSSMAVQKGARVKAGDLIGLSGGTPGTLGAGAWTNGPHLHLGIFDHTGFLDPAKLLPKPSK